MQNSLMEDNQMKKLSFPTIVFIILVILNNVIVFKAIQNQLNYREEKISDIILQVEDKLELVLDNIYHSTDVLEQLVLESYDNKDEKKLDIIFTPIIEGYGYQNISIIPKGVIEYVYPPDGFENIIGFDILSIPTIVDEANLDVNSGQDIAFGPSNFSECKKCFTIRKSIFVGDEFWGFLAITISNEALLEKMNINPLFAEDYNYKFTVSGKDLGTIIVGESENFDEDKAKWVEIELPSGSWRFGIDGKYNTTKYISFIILLAIGDAISLIIARYILKLNNKLKVADKETYLDRLTGVHNRKILEKLHKDFLAKDIDFTVVFIDLNEFKPINDTYGHDIGDKILISFAERLQILVRDTDYVIRMGGDEFLLILPTLVKAEYIASFLNRLNKIKIEPVVIGDITLPIKFSYGVTTVKTEEKNLLKAVENADVKMYEAKKESKKEIKR